MDAYVSCSRNKVYLCHFFVEMALCPHGEVQGKQYNLMDLLVHSEQIEPSPVFVACFNQAL